MRLCLHRSHTLPLLHTHTLFAARQVRHYSSDVSSCYEDGEMPYRKISDWPIGTPTFLLSLPGSLNLIYWWLLLDILVGFVLGVLFNWHLCLCELRCRFDLVARCRLLSRLVSQGWFGPLATLGRDGRLSRCGCACSLCNTERNPSRRGWCSMRQWHVCLRSVSGIRMRISGRALCWYFLLRRT